MDLVSIYIKIALLVWFTFCVAGIVAHLLAPFEEYDDDTFTTLYQEALSAETSQEVEFFGDVVDSDEFHTNSVSEDREREDDMEESMARAALCRELSHLAKEARQMDCSDKKPEEADYGFITRKGKNSSLEVIRVLSAGYMGIARYKDHYLFGYGPTMGSAFTAMLNKYKDKDIEMSWLSACYDEMIECKTSDNPVLNAFKKAFQDFETPDKNHSDK